MRTVHYKSAVQGCNFCMNTMLSLLAHTKEDFFMLYNVVVNDWGETTYVPTALGNVLLVVVLIALLAVAVVFARKQRNKTGADDVDQKMAHSKLTVKQLAFCAMAIALGTVLSNIKLFHFPTGGSITLLSMLVICLPGYWFGLGAGIATGVAYGVLQLLIDPYVLYPLQLVVDYLLAFGALGLSGLFSNAKLGLIKGYCRGSWKICVCRDLRMDLLRLLCLGRLGSPALLPRLQCYLYLL